MSAQAAAELKAWELAFKYTQLVSVSLTGSLLCAEVCRRFP
jgi:hypothetical protein